jgi:hypothetical protein
MKEHLEEFQVRENLRPRQSLTAFGRLDQLAIDPKALSFGQ